MYGPVNSININIDIRDCLVISENADAKNLNDELYTSIKFLTMGLRGFNFGKCKKEFSDIKKKTKEIIEKLESDLVEEYLMCKSGIIYKNTNGEFYGTIIERYRNLLKLLEAISETLPSGQGRPKTSVLSINYTKRMFIHMLMQIYKTATAKKPTRNAHNSNSSGTVKTDYMSDFNNFANKVIETINSQCPNLENEHNISISSDDYMRMRGENTKRNHI